jgi:hypothetical protein
MTDAPHMTLVSNEKKSRRGTRPRAPRRHEAAIQELRKEFFGRLEKVQALKEEVEHIEFAMLLFGARTLTVIAKARGGSWLASRWWRRCWGAAVSPQDHARIHPRGPLPLVGARATSAPLRRGFLFAVDVL